MFHDLKTSQAKDVNQLLKNIIEEPNEQQLLQINQITKLDNDKKNHQNYESKKQQQGQEQKCTNLHQNSTNFFTQENRSNLQYQLQNNEEKKQQIDEHFKKQSYNVKKKGTNIQKSHSNKDSNQDDCQKYILNRQLNLQEDYKIDSQNQQCLDQFDTKQQTLFEPHQNNQQSNLTLEINNISSLLYSKNHKKDSINKKEFAYQRQITEEKDNNNSNSGLNQSRISHDISEIENFKESSKPEEAQSRRFSRIFEMHEQMNNDCIEKMYFMENSQGSDFNYLYSNQSSNMPTPQMVSLKEIKINKNKTLKVQIKKQGNHKYFSQASSPLQNNQEHKQRQIRSYQKNQNQLSINIGRFVQDGQSNQISEIQSPIDSVKHQKNTMSFGMQQQKPCFYNQQTKHNFQRGILSAQKSPINEEQNSYRNPISSFRKESQSKSKQVQLEKKIKDLRILSERKQIASEQDQKIKELELDLFLKRQQIQEKDDKIKDQQQKIEFYIQRIKQIPNEQDWESDFHNLSEFLDDYPRIIYQLISKQDPNNPYFQMINQKSQKQQKVNVNEIKNQQNIFLQDELNQKNKFISEVFDDIKSLKTKSQIFGSIFGISIEDLFKKLFFLSKKEKFRNRLLDLNECLKYEIEELNNFLKQQDKELKISDLKDAFESEILLQKQINQTILHTSTLFKERIIQIQEGHKEMQEDLKKKTPNN